MVGLSETIKKVIVVRNGKKMVKWKTDKPGYKIEMDKSTKKPKEVILKNKEKTARRIGQKVAKVKRAAKSEIFQKKRIKSFKIRKQLNLKYKPDIKTIKRVNKKIGK